MVRTKFTFTCIVICCLMFYSASAQTNFNAYRKNIISPPIFTGADQTNLYINYLKGKNIGMVINQTSVIGKNLTASVDSLVHLGVAVKKIFGPEHGFRGNASNGATVGDAKDPKTGLPVISLYGNKHYKPTAADLKGIDL